MVLNYNYEGYVLGWNDYIYIYSPNEKKQIIKWTLCAHQSRETLAAGGKSLKGARERWAV